MIQILIFVYIIQLVFAISSVFANWSTYYNQSRPENQPNIFRLIFNFFPIIPIFVAGWEYLSVNSEK